MNDKDICIIRNLAEKVAAIAADPQNEKRKQRWRDVNALRKPDRAPVWCKPVNAWKEILPADSLQCEDPWACSIESYLNKIIIKNDIGDDSPVDDYFPVGTVFSREPANTWGVDLQNHQTTVDGGAWAYNPPLKEESDFDRLILPRFTLDQSATDAALEKAAALFGDTLPVKEVCNPSLSGTLGTMAAELVGLNDLMINLLDKPDFMHKLMGYLRDAVLTEIDTLEVSGKLTPNNNVPMYCSDPIAADTGSLTCKNLWINLNSQEFDQVSPPMWEEFLLEYQKPIMERYGLTAYGCCENLTHKIDGVLSIPNLRIFVCSAWSDLDEIIKRTDKKYTIMWRQKASDVIFSDDVSGIKDHLDDGTRRLQGHYYQIVLRELETLQGHTDRLHVWTELAKEAASRNC